MKRLLPLALACLTVFAGCRKPAATTAASSVSPTLVPGTLINSPGSWWAPHGPGSFSVEINPIKGGLEYRFRAYNEPTPYTGQLSSGGGAPIDFPSWPPDWFIYAEDTGSPKILWFYGDSRRVWYTVIEYPYNDPPNHMVIDQNGKWVKGSRRPPVEVIQRLPADLQKLFPAGEVPVGRPAF